MSYHEPTVRSPRLACSPAPSRVAASRRPAGAQPAPGNRLDRLAHGDALSRRLSGVVAGRTRQRYVDEDYSGDIWRQSDDMTIVTKDDYPNHELWAKAGKAAAATVKLKSVGSGIELVETATEHGFSRGSDPDVTLKRVVAKNLKNKTEGDDMTLYADCGRSASLIVGGSDRRAKYALRFDRAAVDSVDESNPTLMKIGIMRNWLKDQIVLHKDQPGDTTDITGMESALSKGDALDVELQALNTEKAKWTKATTKDVRDAWPGKYKVKLKQVSEAYFAYYNALPHDSRDKIDAAMEINHYARPEVGQGFTTSSGGAKVKGSKSTWNFHWGGVVMKSDDGADIVVLENYSVSQWGEENENWTFDMYGTKSRTQTFHGRHSATGQHGQTPTTMIIEKR